MKNKFLLSLLGLFASLSIIGTTYATWIFNNNTNINNTVNIEVPE